MPNPPAPLNLRESSHSPRAHLVHNHVATPSVPIPQCHSAASDSLPLLTGASTTSSTFLQTPLAVPSPLSRPPLINPSSPSPIPLPKAFPHAADLLGGPSEASTSRRSTPAPSSIDEVEDIASPASDTPSTPTIERAARVRERLATRRAERAVETLTQQRSHSRHIFDPEPIAGPSLAELSRQASDVGRIAPAFRLPNDYVPTPAILSFGDLGPDLPTYPSVESISLPRMDQHAQTQAASRVFAGPSSVPSSPSSSLSSTIPSPRPAESMIYPQPSRSARAAPTVDRSSERARELRDYLARLEERRAASRPQREINSSVWDNVLADEIDFANNVDEFTVADPGDFAIRGQREFRAPAPSPLVDMWNHSIQQTVDRRLPVEPQRDARMAQHLGDGYSQARRAAMDDSVHARSSRWAEDQARYDEDGVRRRLAAVAGPGGGGEMWGEVPPSQGSAGFASRFEIPGRPSHPYLRHAQAMEDPLNRPFYHEAPPYRTFPGNMLWYDYDTLTSIDPLPARGGYNPVIDLFAPSRPIPPAPSGMVFRSGQTKEEQKTIVRMLMKGVQRLPPSSRKKAAESMVRKMLWSEREALDNGEDETICAVCHDEYQNDSTISVTPCKHMYHKDCLDVWLDQPHISSCPMCRRDLAVLACVEKMLGKGKEEAVSLWMSV